MKKYPCTERITVIKSATILQNRIGKTRDKLMNSAYPRRANTISEVNKPTHWSNSGVLFQVATNVTRIYDGYINLILMLTWKIKYYDYSCI